MTTRVPLTSKLQCQKALMRERTGRGSYGVYVYLRAEDSENGPAGSPYYIGKMSRAYRPWGPHTVPFPSNPALVRLLKGGLSDEQAQEWERRYIKHYGRIQDGTGILRNGTAGGEGVAGAKFPKPVQVKKSMVQEAAARAGVSPDEWLDVPRRTRNAFMMYIQNNPEISLDAYLRGARAPKVASPEAGAKGGLRQRENAAARRGADTADYLTLTRAERSAMFTWLKGHPGKTGADWLALDRAAARDGAVRSRAIAVATRLGVCPAVWVALPISSRKTVGKRHAKGKRGEALLEGLI
jgi:hypothetical protein